MGFGVDGIVRASMSMIEANFESAYNIAMIKKAMEGMEMQGEALTEMLASVPAPSPYGFDVYG